MVSHKVKVCRYYVAKFENISDQWFIIARVQNMINTLYSINVYNTLHTEQYNSNIKSVNSNIIIVTNKLMPAFPVQLRNSK